MAMAKTSATTPATPAISPAMSDTTATAACPAVAASVPATTSPVAASYEQAVNELDHLVASMEAGQLPLDRLLDNYRRGAELLSFCRGQLEAVEEQVKILEDGQLKPWAAN